MLAEDLIKHLKDLIDLHGNIPVYVITEDPVCYGEYIYQPIRQIEFLREVFSKHNPIPDRIDLK